MSENQNKITFETLAKLLPLHVKTDQVPFLAGEPGIGKSATIKKLADQFNTKVFILSVNGISTKEDLTGARMVEDKDAKYGAKQVFFPTATVQDAVNYANAHPTKPVILFLDEINRTTPDVTSAFMSVITERKVGNVDLPKNIRLIAAGNDEGNVSQLDTASISRMQVYHVAPDVGSFLKVQPNLNNYIKQLVTTHPEYLVQTTNNNETSEDDDDDDSDAALDELSDNDQMSQITVPRTLTYMSDFLNAAGFTGGNVPDDLENYFEPLDPYNSPLQYAIEATLGKTEASHQLFENIVDSINQLSMQTNNNQTTKPVQVPEPNPDIIAHMNNDIESDDDINALFNDPNFNNDDYINSFFTLIQPKEYQKLKYTDALNSYFDQLSQLVDKDSKNMTKIAKSFNELLTNKQIAQPVIEHIENGPANTLSNHLNILISVNS